MQLNFEDQETLPKRPNIYLVRVCRALKARVTYYENATRMALLKKELNTLYTKTIVFQ